MSKSRGAITSSLVVYALGVCLALFFPTEVDAASVLRPLADTIAVGGACGSTIQACINSADVGDIILIPAGEYTGSLILNKKVSLIGANRETTVIRASSQERALTISDATVNASVVISGLTFTKAAGDEGACTNICGGIVINANAQPSLINLLISNNISMVGAAAGLDSEPGSPLRLANIHFVGNSGRAAFLRDNATILDSHFENNTGFSGAALSITGTLVMTDTDFIGNVTTGNGGAVYASDTRIYGGSFVNNRSIDNGGSGGALYINGTLYAQDIEFVGNSVGAGSYGGAVYIYSAQSIVIDSRFENNRANGYGGGIYGGGNLILTNTDFISNTSGIAGGGASVYSAATVSGGRFENNSAASSGGGLFASGAVIDGTIFVSNTSASEGGGAALQSLAQVRNVRFENNQAASAGGMFLGDSYGEPRTITSTLFLNNKGVSDISFGGGLYASNVILQDVRFEKNHAQAYGGGWYATDIPGTDTTAQGVEFVQNTAYNGGGAFLGPRYGELTDCLFEENQALNGYGGGLYLGGSMGNVNQEPVIAHCKFLANTASISGGAIIVPYTLVYLDLSDSTFENNSAAVDGGAIGGGYNSGGSIATSLFLANKAGGNGGAINGAGFSVSQDRFVGNQAELGGGIYSEDGGIYVENTLFSQNVAMGEGGAALHFVSGYPSLNYLTVADATLNPKPAIYYSSYCGTFRDYPFCSYATVNSSIIANHAVGIFVDETHGPGNEYEDDIDTFYADYVLLSGVTTPISALASIFQGPNSFRGNADFVNPALGNYELGINSQARDAAAIEDCPTVDLRGVMRPQVLGCDIGAFEGDPVSPVIVITPSAMSFIAMSGLGQPIAQTLTISNTGVGTLNWSASGDPSWISGAPASGSQNGTVAVKVNHTGLALGNHEGTLTISGNAVNPEVSANVQLEVLSACTILAANGDFEQGNSGAWQTSSALGNSLIRTASAMGTLGTPHSGGYAVVLGSVNGDDNELSQLVKLPSGGALSLEYYYQIASNEENCTFDRVHVLLGNTQVAEHGLCPANNTTGWTKGTVDVAPYGNHVEQLRFVLQNDALGSPSTFLLDDVAIVAATTATCDAPSLQVTPVNLTFSTQAGGENLAAQSLQINNVGSGTLNWSASETLDWLFISSTNGSAPATLNVSVDISDLAVGTYNGEIVVTASGADASPQTILVILTVTDESLPANLQVTPTNLTFNAVVGGQNPAAQSLSVNNLGGGDLNWSVSETLDWLSLSSTGGSGPATLNLNVNISTLTAGVYDGEIVVAASDAENSPRTIPVVLTVTEEDAPPNLQVMPTSLTFSALAGGENPISQTLQINNIGGGMLNWSASETSAWLSLDAPNGTAPSTLIINVDSGALAVGVYNTEIVVAASGADSSPRTIPIVLTVAEEGAQANLQVTPSALNFVVAGSNPDPQPFSIHFTGSGAWTATESLAWLSLDNGSGTADANVQVTVDATGMTKGNYSGQIVLTAPGTIPQVITVSLLITDKISDEHPIIFFPSLHK